MKLCVAKRTNKRYYNNIERVYSVYIHTTYTHNVYTHEEEGDAMNALTQTNNAIQVKDIATLYDRYIGFLDASPKTVATYTRALRQFFRYLAKQGITQPVRADVIAYREALKADHKPSTVQSYIIAIRLFFQWTETEGLYPNIAAHIKGAKISRNHKKDYLTALQVKNILAGIERDTPQGRRDYAIFTLMVTCGLRDIEIHRANIGDLSQLGYDAVLYLQGKGKEEKADYVKVPQAVEEAIRSSLADRTDTIGNDPLFVSLSNNSTGKRISTRSISGTVKARMKAAGYDSDRLTAHSLRHTAVTLSLLGGNTLQEVQQFARHADISTTTIYAHNLDKAKNNCSGTVADSIF